MIAQRTRRRRIAVAACLPAGLLWAIAASAQSSEPLFPYDPLLVPADGGLLLLTLSSGVGQTSSPVPTEIRVAGPDGATLAGEVRDIGWVQDTQALSRSVDAFVGAGLVWVPDAPLEVGKPYRALALLTSAQAVQTGIEITFEVGEASTRAPPKLELGVRATRVELSAEVEHCCSKLPDGSGGDGCFLYMDSWVAALEPVIDTTSDESVLQQFTWLLQSRGPEPDDHVWESAWSTHGSTPPSALFPAFDREQMCLELRARDLLDDAEHSWAACLPEGTVVEGVRDTREEIAAGLELERCAVPELGDVPQWCAINEARCDGAADDSACAAYPIACDGPLGAFPERLEAWRATFTHDAASDADLDAGAVSDAGPTTADAEGAANGGDADSDCGCRAPGRRTPSTHPSATLALLAALALHRRRRAWRRWQDGR